MLVRAVNLKNILCLFHLFFRLIGIKFVTRISTGVRTNEILKRWLAELPISFVYSACTEMATFRSVWIFNSVKVYH